jgi:acyl-CoA thioesterase II
VTTADPGKSTERLTGRGYRLAMGDLAADTTIVAKEGTAEAGNFRTSISEDWAIWGPMGGYIASIAMRAAGAHCGRARPASINVHFLAVAKFGPADVEVRTLRVTRVATSLAVTIHQDDRPVLEALVWGTDATDGLEHHTGRSRPDAPDPELLPSFVERIANSPDGEILMPFWHRVDYRPTNWIDDWEHREPSEPAQSSWFRFPQGETRHDAWLDACRLLIVTDLDAWGAATLAHSGDLDWFAPTIELTCRFLQPAHDDPWLLSRGSAPVGRSGLIGVDSETWSVDGRLLAIGGSTLLCRPAPERPA